ncbi:MAG TPA: hypothetical protein VMF06_06520 [Candidatus Limnocylindria bacterium]|jgi:hypothetical protein|nr:hypothetical protein [Candidatus Limnocylindria bacterium]
MKTLVPTDRFLSRMARAGVSLLVAGVLWIPVIHFCFRRPATDFWRAEGVSSTAEQLANQQMQTWRDPVARGAEIQRLRRVNAEWDFMGRTFLVWSLANLTLRDPSRQGETLPVMDQIITETLALEKSNGPYVFLLPYARSDESSNRPFRSLFVDGEIALMLAARQTVAESDALRQPLRERIAVIEASLKASPILSAESYPNECWTLDHAVALAALRVGDQVMGSDHRQMAKDWLRMAKTRLIHPATGLLVSRYTMNGEVVEGPEGSSIWMVAHCLALVDETFARAQYLKAKQEIGRTFAGFGYAEEWPASFPGEADVDSGPIVPLLHISAGSSGMAFIAAAQFGDEVWLRQLHSTLEMSAFPIRGKGALRFAASNQVGDAAMLYATTMGPLWKKAGKGSEL